MSVNILHPSFILFIYNAPLACKGSVFGKVGAEKKAFSHPKAWISKYNSLCEAFLKKLTKSVK